MFKFGELITNRVLMGMLFIFVAVGLWEFKWKPQYRPHYEQGISYYHAQRYDKAVEEFGAAYAIAPNSTDVLTMCGWSNFKLRRFDEAAFYFTRALRIDPRIEEARLGNAFIALETGRGKLDYDLLRKHLGAREKDPNVQIVSAGALRQEGRNFDAAVIYEDLLSDKNYGHAARVALDELYGLEGFANDPVALAFGTPAKPAQVQARFRAADQKMWRMENGQWQPMYIAGVNLGPGSPGYYPSSPPMDGQIYAKWLQDAEALNANVIRAYTLLPPSFYRAYRHHVSAGGKLVLYQQIWFSDPAGKDLYDADFVKESEAEIRYAVDAIHGHGNVPLKHARGSGIYDSDIAEHVGAILLGRELEASVALQTNLSNPGRTRFEGKYINVPKGNPTEVWFAQILEYLVSYETETYGWQHPVAIVNWPPLDPLYHPTEAPNLEEVKYRIKRGEKLTIPNQLEDDNDTASIDEANYYPTPALQAGFFASYHVYPYYPDFLLFDPQYQKARDSEGPNPVFGYLQELRAHVRHPLVVTEYGVPNSIGISHFHPGGWHHGGHGEAQQAQIVAQLSRSIREAGCAGGVVFSLVDEWYKHNWLRADFQHPEERAALWQDVLDPEKYYGLIGFQTAKAHLFSDVNSWAGEKTLYSGGRGAVQSVQGAADESFLYLKLNGACVNCATGKKKEQASYVVALNTMPGNGGVKTLPYGVSIQNGADFVLEITPASAKLLIASDYNPYGLVPKVGVPNETELVYRRSFHARLEPTGGFEEMIVETNRRRFARDGTSFAGQRYSRSLLRAATDVKDRAPGTIAEWYSDAKARAIVVRIPWGKLQITDPSSHQAFAGFNDQAQLMSTPTPGVDVSLLEFASADPSRSDAKMVATLPAMDHGTLPAAQRIQWQGWEKVQPQPYFKQVYYALQKVFLEQTHAEMVTTPVAAGAGARGKRASR